MPDHRHRRIHGTGRIARLALLLALLLSVLLPGCSSQPDETQIRNAIGAMAKAVEDKDRGGFAEYLAPDFQAGSGMDQRGLAQLLLFEFRRNNKIGVYVVSTDIKVDGAWATAVIRVAVTGASGWLPQRARYYRVTTRWHKHDGRWRVSRARWVVVAGAPTT